MTFMEWFYLILLAAFLALVALGLWAVLARVGDDNARSGR